MDDGSARVPLDKTVCKSCEHLIVQKDQIIEDLKRNVAIQEDLLRDRDYELKNLQDRITNVVAGIFI